MQENLLNIWLEVRNRYTEVMQGERGATAVEYAIMVALIAAVVIAGATFLGNKTNNTLNGVGNALP